MPPLNPKNGENGPKKETRRPKGRFRRREGHRDGEIGLAGSGRPDTHDDVIRFNSLQVSKLVGTSGDDRLICRGLSDSAAEELAERNMRIFLYQSERDSKVARGNKKGTDRECLL